MKAKILLLLFFFSFQIHSQELLPFVENYSKSNYQGDNQIWSVAQGNDNAMYFANNYYFLRYDGVKWEKYSLPNKTIIRSVMVNGDRIYTGSYKEFGYWTRNNGKMIYTSISDKTKIFEDSDKAVINFKEKFNVTVDVTNTWNYDGKEVVQLYIRDLVGSVTRPVRELKGFQKIDLKKGQMQKVLFELSIEDLKFYNSNLKFEAEPGRFEIFVGTNSNTENKVSFELIE